MDDLVDRARGNADGSSYGVLRDADGLEVVTRTWEGSGLMGEGIVEVF